MRRIFPGGVDGAFDAANIGLPALDTVRARRLEEGGIRGRLVLLP